ncbi:isoleucine--tRNA ligase [Blattabacterium cuenoti]|uniref:isoleucine--tRNA ligase n=1 Tax=Blattabacterium cuenoti TaxID=1653831 RepID=UPI00163C2BB7|nr:isoleucine--tRNA ligase [Blattabacterium cuenoti]
MSEKFLEYKKLDLKKIYNNIDKYWKDYKLFQKIQDNFLKNFNNKNSYKYVLYEGPPSLNGDPGIHHVLSRTIKDIFCRYHSLKGKIVFRKSGWDTHGLPIEINVEKKIGINKNDVGKKISINDYNKICKKFVNESLKKWINFTNKIGYWIDLKNYFKTYDSKYIESVWWIIKELYKKNLLYNGYTVQPYSPYAGTGLSYHELNMPGTYKKVEQVSPIVKFKLIKNTLSNKIKNIIGDIYLLSWTTTPWTLPSNTALSVGYNVDYLLIKIYNFNNSCEENLIFSEKSINKILEPNKYYEISNHKSIKLIYKEKIPYFKILKFKGKYLFNSRYEQLLPWFKPYYNYNNAFKIVNCDFIDINEGTGIVHISPTFGLEDFLISKKYNIPSMIVLQNNKLVPLVDFQGKFINNFPHGLSEKYIKKEFNPKKNETFSVENKIISLLKKENKIFKSENYKHFYPHCWRTERPIIYYPLYSWFFKTTSIKDKMIDLNNKINWYSNSHNKKNNRFNSWLKNIKDWNLSRSRFWGTPLPIWKNKSGKEKIVIGSIKELILEIKKSIKNGIMSYNILEKFKLNDMSDENYKNIDLHKHVLDKIILVSSKGEPMKRDPDLIDVWFDSGSMPYAQFHYPFENKNIIEKNILFPSDFISEGLDQTRGWFFSLHTISCAISRSISYKNVVSTGLVLDKNGQKMSKSKGNTIDPINLINNYGPDAIRWYIVSNSEPWDNSKFDVYGINTVIKRFFGTLYNVYSFFTMYANIDGFSYKEKDCIDNYNDMDLWIISKLNNLIKDTEKSYNNYNPNKVTRLVTSFVINNLSNWYIRICRRRFWKEKYTKNKISAYQVLYTCLISVSKIISPIVPFFSEIIYVNLNSITNKENFISVHLSLYPIYNINLVNSDLEYKMSLAKKIVNMILSIRKKNNIKIRQPLENVMVICNKNDKYNHLKKISYIILKESNVKKIKFPSSFKIIELFKYIKPNYRSIGKKFRENTKEISYLINNLTQVDIKNLEKNKKIIINTKSQKKFNLLLEDVIISTKYIKNWAISFDNNITVALDLKITESLKKEGIIRDLIRYIQELRKKENFHVLEKILIYINTKNKYINLIINCNKLLLCKETLSKNIFIWNKKEGSKFYIEDKYIFIKIKKYNYI